MTDTRHTPGPWEVSKDATPDYAPQYTVYDEQSGNRVATAFRNEANASLIAAAPDMYDALEAAEPQLAEFVAWCHKRDGGCSMEVESALDAIRAALSKAEGR